MCKCATSAKSVLSILRSHLGKLKSVRSHSDGHLNIYADRLRLASKTALGGSSLDVRNPFHMVSFVLTAIYRHAPLGLGLTHSVLVSSIHLAALN